MRLVAFYSLENKYSGSTINFGGRYFYEIKLQNTHLTITREENKNFIEDFYGLNISLVNAIVGKNGAGKTTLLKNLLQSDKLILLFEDNNQKKSNNWIIGNSKNYSDKTIGLKSFEHEINNSGKLEIDIAALEEKNHFGYNILSQIYHSPTFYYYSPLSNYSLSTKYLDDFSIKEDSVILMRKEILQRQIKLLVDGDIIKSLIKIFEDFPSYSSVKFSVDENINSSIEEIDFKFYSFYKNNELQLKDNLSTAARDKKILAVYTEELKSGKYFDLLNKVQVILKKSKNREKVYYELYVRFLILSFTLISFKNLNVINEKIHELISQLENRKIKSDENFIKIVHETINVFLDASGKSYEFAIKEEFLHIKRTIESMLSFMPHNQIFSSLNLGLSEFYNSYFEFIFRFETHAKDFLLNYTTPFIIFETDHVLSQGEEYLLNLFADIYSHPGIANSRNIVLFLDEPDLGFHPRWKKKLVQSLLKSLPVLINNISPRDLNVEQFDEEDVSSFQSLHIIFTTHNPLTLSDIPNHNVIYLDKEDGTAKILGREDDMRPKYSFATNINDLIMHSFYINDGLMGDFAKEIINDIIIKLNILGLIKEINFEHKNEDVEKKLIYFKSRINIDAKLFLELKKYDDNIENIDAILRAEKNKIFNTISLVGEPVIKFKLLEMYNNIFEKEDKKLTAQLRIEEIAREAGLNINIIN